MLIGYSGNVSQAPITNSFQPTPRPDYQIKLKLYRNSTCFTVSLTQLLGVIKNQSNSFMGVIKSLAAISRVVKFITVINCSNVDQRLTAKLIRRLDSAMKIVAR